MFNKKKVKAGEVHLNSSLVENLKPSHEYIEEYGDILSQMSKEMDKLIKNKNNPNIKKKIDKMMTRCSELVILIPIAQELDKVRKDKGNE